MSTVPPLHAQEGNGSGVPGPIGPYAVWGDSENGEGVLGNSKGADGVFGISDSGQGVVGVSGSGNGVSGTGSTGVHGFSNSGVVCMEKRAPTISV